MVGKGLTSSYEVRPAGSKISIVLITVDVSTPPALSDAVPTQSCLPPSARSQSASAGVRLLSAATRFACRGKDSN